MLSNQILKLNVLHTDSWVNNETLKNDDLRWKFGASHKLRKTYTKVGKSQIQDSNQKLGNRIDIKIETRILYDIRH